MNDLIVKLIDIEETNEIKLYINGKEIDTFNIYKNKNDIGKLVANVLQYGSRRNFRVEYDVVDSESDIDDDAIKDDIPDLDPTDPLQEYFRKMMGDANIDIRWINKEDFDKLKDDLEDIDDLDDLEGYDELPPGLEGVGNLFNMLGFSLPNKKPNKNTKGSKSKKKKKSFNKKRLDDLNCLYLMYIKCDDREEVKMYALGEETDIQTKLKKFAQEQGLGNVRNYFRKLFADHRDLEHFELKRLIKHKLINEALQFKAVDNITEDVYSATDSFAEMSIDFDSDQKVNIHKLNTHE